MLSTKYGKTEKSVELFEEPYYEGDGYELQALRLGKLLYTSMFDAKNGDITLQLIYVDGAHLVLVYTDEHNKALYESEIRAIKYSDL